MNKIKHTILLTLALMLSGGAWAQLQWTSGDCTATLDTSNSMLIISGNGNMADYRADRRGPWGSYSGVFTGLVIEEGVTSIGNYTFSDFSNIHQVILPEGVKTIGAGAFVHCNTLTYVSIPASVTSIDGIDVFLDCINLTDIFLYADPANLTWPENGDDFMSGKATLCHVRPEYLNTYQSNFANVNVTFVGDLPSLINLTVEVTQDANLDWFFTMPPSNAKVGVAYYPTSILTFGANNSNGGTVAMGDTLKFEEFTTTTDPGNYSDERYHFVGEQFQIDAKSFDRDGIHLGSTTVRAIKNQPIVKIEATIGSLNWCQTCYAYYIPENQSQQCIPQPYSVGLTKTIDNINAQSVDFIGTDRYTIQFNKWKVYYNDHSIVYNQDDSYTVRNGSKVTLNAQANEGWHVAGWKDGNGNEMETVTYGEGTNPATSSLTFTMTCDTHAVAYFDTNVYIVFVNVNDEEGSVSGPGMVKHFRSGTYTASAKTCYHFVNWTDAAGTVLGTEETISIAAVSDTAITAHFAKDVYAGDTTAEACDRFAWHGTTYTATPVEAPTFGYKTVNGCDSTVTLRLTINYSNAGDTTAEACDRFAWHGTTYTATPLVAPTYVMTNAEGCDSTVTLLLTIRHSTTGDTTATACDEFVWHGITYTETPEEAPTYVMTNAEGCDSTVTLHLTIRHSNSGIETATACDRYEWQGTVYTESNTTDQHTLTNIEGCDSVVTLNLAVNYHHDTTVYYQSSGEFEFHGITYTENGTYPRVIETMQGCDSNITLVLAYLPHTTPLPAIFNIMNITLFINHFPEGSEKIDYIYYRWYKNGEVVSEGENRDSYSEEGNTLNGCFYLEISTEPTHTYWAKSNEICIGNLGIDGVNDIAMTMAPNPVVRGQQVAVTVSESNLQGAVVNVYDAQGRQVMNFELRNSNFEIPTSTLVSGIYTVRIVLADGRTATKKVVVR